MSENRPPRAVVDTNLVISGTISQRGNPYRVLRAWSDRAFLLVLTPALYYEAEEVLNRPRIRERYNLTDKDIDELLALLATTAVQVDAARQLAVVVRDPKDTRVLAAAIGGQADYLVTGDDDLLVLRDDARLVPLKIVTPREFLLILGVEPTEPAKRV